MRQVLTPYLTVKDGKAAIAFYAQAFGAEQSGMLLTLPDGKVAHAEMRIGNTALFLADENEEWGSRSPLTIGDTPVRMALHVDDVDTAFSRALKAGCEVVVALSDQFYGERAGRVRDPFGHIWILSQHIETVSQEDAQARLDAMMAG